MATTLQNQAIPESSSRLQSLEYPVRGGDEKNAHYVKFNINTNSNAGVVKRGEVGVSGPVNNSGQNRSLPNGLSASQSAALGGIAGGIGGGSAAAKALQGIFAGKAGSTGAAIGGTVLGGMAGGAAGAALGASIGGSPSTQRLNATITLYTPSQIRSSYNMNYSLESAFVADLVSQINPESLTKGITAAASSLTGAAGALGDAGRIAAAMGSTSNNSTLKELSMISKTAINQKKDIMFKSVAPRVFTFDYVFAPRSAIEASNVKDIIYTFKYWQHPELIEGFANFLYIYPAEFDISYGINGAGGESNHLHKISSCVLTKMDVNYAPTGTFQSLEQGEPLMCTMTLTFQEIETLHRQRIADGY